MTKTAPAPELIIPGSINIGLGGRRDARLLAIARRDLKKAKAREDKYKARLEGRLQGHAEGVIKVKGVETVVVKVQRGMQPSMDWDTLLKRYPRIYKALRKETEYRVIKVL